jgi:hypothetical protein
MTDTNVGSSDMERQKDRGGLAHKMRQTPVMGTRGIENGLACMLIVVFIIVGLFGIDGVLAFLGVL